MNNFTMTVKGMEEFNNKMQKLIRSIHPDKIEPILMGGAKIVSKAARIKAPKGPTGNLKKSIRTKKLRRIFNNPATAISAVDRKKSPHAYITHAGTERERVGGPKSVRYRGRKFGRMPANPFMYEAWDETKGSVLDYIIKETSKQVKGAV